MLSRMGQRTARTAVGLLGAAGTLLLHSLFFAVAMWGEGGVQRFPDRPDAIGAGANRGKPDGDAVERRMIVRLLSEIDSYQPSRSATAEESFVLRVSARLPGVHRTRGRASIRMAN